MAKTPVSSLTPEDDGLPAAVPTGNENANPPTPKSAAPTPPPDSSPPPKLEPPDPFSPASLRLGTDYSEGLGVRKVISTVPARKPSNSEWFRVRPGAEWQLQTAVLELEKGVERATYLVSPHLWPELSGEIKPALLLVCINRANDVFMWRVKLPGSDGRTNTWTDSALQIAKAAETTWCRMVADMGNGIYTHFEPTAGMPEPKWPDLSFSAILKLTFRDRMIDSIDHPVLRELRGGA
jgi:hypothetical protein